MTHAWKNFRRDLSDAYKPRPPITYILDGIFAQPSLNIVYGSPGCLKSLLCADLAICIAGGVDWLEPAKWEPGNLKSHSVLAGRVTWIDQDNGENRTANRFEALARARNLPDTDPLIYYSMPSPALDLSKTGPAMDLIDLILSEAASTIFIDNLLTVSGGKDENSSEMAQVMTNLRLVSERSGACIVVIHHSRKENGYKGRQGDNLRGFSGIRGAIDTGLFVDREAGSDIVTVKSEKTRDVDIPPFSAQFTYQHKTGSHDLDTAKFWGVTSATGASEQELQDAIIDIVTANPGLSQTKLARAVKSELPKIGEVRIRAAITTLAQAGKIQTTQGIRGALEYSL